MAVASITEITNRFKRALMLVDVYGSALATTPKKRSFNSEVEITDIILEADELLCWDVRNTIGHEWAPTFFALSSALVHLDKIPASDAPLHLVTWSTTSNGTYAASEEGEKNDIVEAVKDYTLFGVAASDTYGYHDVQGNILFTTNPFTKITQVAWTRTSACQSPISFTAGILCTAIALAFRDGIDMPMIEYCEKKSTECRQMIRSGAMVLPELTQFNLQEQQQ